MTRERTSWRDVPIPESIAGLPRSKGGLPVPYVASWEGEELMEIRNCPNAMGALAIFPKNGTQIGKTRPVFGIMEPSRQREVVMRLLCQVCRRELGDMSSEVEDGREPLWLIDLLHEPKTMRGHRLCMEPFVCDDCLVYALRVCPGMLVAVPPAVSTQIPKDWRLRNVLAVWSSNAIATTVLPHGNLEGEDPCISYLKIEPLRYQRLSSFHLLDRGPEEIRDLLLHDGPPPPR